VSYAQQLAALTHAALNEGISPVEIIRDLELIKLELAHQMFATAREERSPIVPAGGKGPIITG